MAHPGDVGWFFEGCDQRTEFFGVIEKELGEAFFKRLYGNQSTYVGVFLEAEIAAEKIVVEVVGFYKVERFGSWVPQWDCIILHVVV